MNGKRVVLGGLDKNIDVSTDFVTCIAHILDFDLDRIYFLHPNFLSPFLFLFFPLSASSFDSLFFLSFLTYLYLQLLSLSLSLSYSLSLSLSLCLCLSLYLLLFSPSLWTLSIICYSLDAVHPATPLNSVRKLWEIWIALIQSVCWMLLR